MLKYVWVILILIFFIWIFFLGYNKASKKNITPFVTPTIVSFPSYIVKPTRFIYPLSPTISPAVDCKTGSDIRNEKCPPGCVYYGMPLGCVTQAYYDNCQKTHSCPLCLSSSTSIETENGDINIKNLKVGMHVWTISKSGKKELQPIMKLSSIDVGSTYQIIHLILSDNREVFVSPQHPTITGRSVDSLRISDTYDGTTIKSKNLIPYTDTKTYDLLPAGDTGFYFANGIPLGSTLK